MKEKRLKINRKSCIKCTKEPEYNNNVMRTNAILLHVSFFFCVLKEILRSDRDFIDGKLVVLLPYFFFVV